MLEIWRESKLYQVVIAINRWFGNLFSNSALVRFFMHEKDDDNIQKNSIFAKLVNAVIKFFRKIFHALKLDKLLEGTIFAKPTIWITFVLMLVPFLPTMLVLAMVIACMLSLFLKAILEEDFELKYFKTNIWVLAFAFVVGFLCINFCFT